MSDNIKSINEQILKLAQKRNIYVCLPGRPGRFPRVRAADYMEAEL